MANKNKENLQQKPPKISKDIDDKLRILANLLIDKVIEMKMQGLLKSTQQ